MRIAIADDERWERDLLSEALRGTAVEVVQSSSGPELLQLILDEGPFDLIVTDHLMPRMSGLEVMTQIRRAGILTPCVFVTGSSDELVLEAVARLDRARLLKKPFLVSELRARVAELVEPAR